VTDYEDFRTDVPAPARVWDHLLGGKDNFIVDREAATELLAAHPLLAVAAWQGREFAARAVRYLTRECGVDQFLDIGCGVPRAPNVHQIAQADNPYARVVYVDRDVLVRSHAQALMYSTREGAVEVIYADLRQPDTILNAPKLRDTLDFHRPVGLLLSDVLQDLADEDQPYDVVKQLVQSLPPGSFVALSHLAGDPSGVGEGSRLTTIAASVGYGPLQPRDRDSVARFLAGLDLVPPGLVSTAKWHPDPKQFGGSDPEHALGYAGVGKLP
jgi:SAM-dependent methyltransferase